MDNIINILPEIIISPIINLLFHNCLKIPLIKLKVHQLWYLIGGEYCIIDGLIQISIRMNNDLEDEILSRIKRKHKTNRKSIIAGLEGFSGGSSPTLVEKVERVERVEEVIRRDSREDGQKRENLEQEGKIEQPQPQLESPSISQQQLCRNFEAQVLASFDSMLMHKVKSIQSVLTSIQNKVQSIEPKVQLKVNHPQILNKVQKAINQTLDKSLSGVKDNLRVSIDYYNHQLSEREKKFNKQHEETARVAIESNMAVLEMRGKRGELDYKRLEEKIKMLMRHENKCEELLGQVGTSLTKIATNIREFNEGLIMDGKYKSVKGGDYDLEEVTEEELLERILENYELEMSSPEMKEYLYQEIGIKRTRK